MKRTARVVVGWWSMVVALRSVDAAFDALLEPLQRLPPNEFERRVQQLPLALVLFCVPARQSCIDLDATLSKANNMLRAAGPSHKLRAHVRLVDMSLPGASSIRNGYDITRMPSFKVFKYGVASPFGGDAKSTSSIVQELIRLANESTSSPAHDGRATVVTIPMDMRSLWHTIDAHPLLIVLFTASSPSGSSRQMSHLASNFTAAAERLLEQGVPVRFGWMRILPDQGEQTKLDLKRKNEVTELPDIKIFHWQDDTWSGPNGMRHSFSQSSYQASADVLSIIDVARWTVGTSMKRSPMSRVHQIVGLSSLTDALSKAQCMLLVFSNKWCTRCIRLAPEYDVASVRLYEQEPPIALSLVDVDDPRNAELLVKYPLYSIPSARYFFRGKLRGDFVHGDTAEEIVNQMSMLQDDLLRASAMAAKLGSADT